MDGHVKAGYLRLLKAQKEGKPFELRTSGPSPKRGVTPRQRQLMGTMASTPFHAQRRM